MPLHAGWLKKRGGGHRSSGFRERWFVIVDGTIKYYKKPPSSSGVPPRGSIPLAGAIVLPVGERQLQVQNQTRVYVCEASTGSDRDRWVAAMHAAMPPSPPSGTRPRTVTEQLGVPHAPACSLPPQPASDASDDESDEAEAPSKANTATNTPPSAHLTCPDSDDSDDSSSLREDSSRGQGIPPPLARPMPPQTAIPRPPPACALPSNSSTTSMPPRPTPLKPTMSDLQRRVVAKKQREWATVLQEETEAMNTASTSNLKVASRHEKPAGLDRFEEQLWSAFMVADRDGSGQLSRLEFTLALKEAGVVDNDEDARQKWEWADCNASGSIEWSEFLALGRSCHALVTLADRLHTKPESLQVAARLIQHASRKRLVAKLGDGITRPTHATNRV